MRSRRESMTSTGNGNPYFAPVTRQNSFLSPLDSNYNKRMSISSRSSLVRSPDRTSNKDNKKRRLSLLPSTTGSLGAPRLLHQKPPTVTNFTTNFTNTQSTLRNSTSGIPVQQLVQNSMARSKLPIQRGGTQFSRPPSSGNRYETPPVSTSRLYSKPKPLDPRPLRSHKFQAKMQEELHEYLSTNRFDIEMKTQLSPRTLKTPSQKDFVLIFQWLYKKLDPGYRFNRSIEQDVYMLLKFLEYPYLENINKSQISAVGGENWHTFLGMLYWLLELVRESMKLDDLHLNSIQESQKPNQSDESGLSDDQYLLNKLFINYALKSYKEFLTDGAEDYSEFYDEMQREYGEYIEQIQVKNNAIIEINENLQETMNSLNQKYNMFHQHLEKGAMLKTDVKEFSKHIDNNKQRQREWPNVLKNIQIDIESLQDSIKNLMKEKSEIDEDLKNKHLTLKDIEDLHKERAHLTDELNNIDTKQQSTRKLVDNKLVTLASEFNDLKIRVNAYNNEMYSILNDISLKIDLDTSKLIIGSLDNELQSTKIGVQANDIIPLLPTLRSSLSDMKSSIQSSLFAIQNEVMNSQSTVEDLELSISTDADKADEQEDLLSGLRKELTELKENIKTDSLNKDLEIQENAREISMFKIQAAERKKTTEKKWKDTQNLYKSTFSNIRDQKKELIFKINTALNNVINFKSDVMCDLEDAAHEARNEVKEQLEIISKHSDDELQESDVTNVN